MQEAGTPGSVWGEYPNYDDISRFEYGRMFWRKHLYRQHLLEHWLDERHPYRERFQENRQLVEEILSSCQSPEDLDRSLRERGTSLRCVVREIPPVFGQFFQPFPKEKASSEPLPGEITTA
jgi:hypothetical protein